MTKGLFNAAKELAAKIKNGILSTQAQDALLQSYTQAALAIIAKRVRSGRGVTQDGGVTQPLKVLSRRYIRHRTLHVDQLSPETSPRKSNLTYSGQLIAHMTAKRNGLSRWVITFQGSRKGGLTNAKLAQYVQNDRFFLGLAQVERIKLSKVFRSRFRELVKSSAK